MLDDYPASYDAYAKRQHRWTRGDWQIAALALSDRARCASAANGSQPLPLISRWKILDNLRRSLVAPSLFLWLAGCLRPLSRLAAALDACLSFIAIAFPVYLHVTTSLLIHPRGIPWTSHFWSVWGDVQHQHCAGRAVVCLSAASGVPDVLTRSCARSIDKLISRKKLLEWVSAAEAERSARNDLASFFRFMLPAELLTLVAVALTLGLKPGGACQ